jgi:hypothetical protein
MSEPAEISHALRALQEALSAEIQRVRGAVSAEVLSALNNAVRRLRQADSRDAWIRTLNETASSFCERSSFFPVTSRAFWVDGVETPLSSSPAIASAVESKDTVVAAATAGELSDGVLRVIGDARRVWLTPVLVRDKAVGILCAVPAKDSTDVSAIELLASLAAASVVSAPETTVESKPAELVRIAGIAEAAPPAESVRPAWSDLARSEQGVHLRAQRFARTIVAQWLLDKTEAVERGRASSNLYDTLREEIDEGRDFFRRQFIETCPSMVDYLHLELVRTLARDDSAALGADYPGPLP